MFLSVFDLFKIGIGPSSSHTMGPMTAAGRFIDALSAKGTLEEAARVTVRLYGSLAFTGKGHGTDRACMLGLMGMAPDSVDPDQADASLHDLAQHGQMRLAGRHELAFDTAADIIFDYDTPVSVHPNALRLVAFAADGAKVLHAETYYSVGGGFVMNEAEMNARGETAPAADVPYPFATAQEMLSMGAEADSSIAAMKFANECRLRSEGDVRSGLDGIWQAMDGCISRGLHQGGVLPGGLKVRRRAKSVREAIARDIGSNRQYRHDIMDWLSLYAMAVNEENAGGGRVVTAPTNGAAGIIPSVIRYYLEFCPDADRRGVHDFLLTAGAVGGIIKANASISGAEVGCQGEVGSASAMAAAGLAAALGADNARIENAAEIALEHHLGMTCDPVGGLVQIPCIERNAMGAVKAVNACSLSMKGDGSHLVSLDTAIRTMYETGCDMQSKYKETSQGGLAVNVVAC